MTLVDIIIEIPYNSFVKYEYDEEKKVMRCDRVLHTAMAYPGNYGFIPNTLSGDGDPLDILMICEYPLYPGTIVKAKIIGVLFTTDEKGEDEKIIAVPAPKIDPHYSNIHNYTDLPKWTLSKIKHFFKHYKDTEENKWVKVKEFKGKVEAMQVYHKAISLNNQAHLV